ncbi:hypothetical protein GCM10027421_09820 [Microbacterium shaanxiense]
MSITRESDELVPPPPELPPEQPVMARSATAPTATRDLRDIEDIDPPRERSDSGKVGLLWTTVFRLARCATICPMRTGAETRLTLEFGNDRQNVQRTAD